jgi:hypothetical protein
MFRFLFGLILGAVAATAGLAAYPIVKQDSSTAPPTPLPHGTRDVRVSFGAAALAEILRDSVARGGAPTLISIASVELGEGSFTIRGTTPRDPPNVPVTIRLSPRVEHGTLRVQVESISVGLVFLPAQLSPLVEQPLNERLQATAGNLPYTITNVHVTPIEMVVTVQLATARFQTGKATRRV